MTRADWGDAATSQEMLGTAGHQPERRGRGLPEGFQRARVSASTLATGSVPTADGMKPPGPSPAERPSLPPVTAQVLAELRRRLFLTPTVPSAPALGPQGRCSNPTWQKAGSGAKEVRQVTERAGGDGA